MSGVMTSEAVQMFDVPEIEKLQNNYLRKFGDHQITSLSSF